MPSPGTSLALQGPDIVTLCRQQAAKDVGLTLAQVRTWCSEIRHHRSALQYPPVHLSAVAFSESPASIAAAEPAASGFASMELSLAGVSKNKSSGLRPMRQKQS